MPPPRLACPFAIRVGYRGAVIKSLAMNERQQAHIDYFLERIEYWGRLKRDDTLARMLAARDADDAHPLRSEEEGSQVFDYLRRCKSSDILLNVFTYFTKRLACQVKWRLIYPSPQMKVYSEQLWWGLI